MVCSKEIKTNHDFKGVSKIVNLPDPTTNKDAVNKDYVDDNTVKVTGGTFIGAITVENDLTVTANLNVTGTTTLNDTVQMATGAIINKFSDVTGLGSSDSELSTQNAIKTYVDDQIAGLSLGTTLPAGVIQSWAGSSVDAPNGWLMCSGQSVATATYDDLYAAIGNEFGGNSTNFNLPDLRGRVSLGVSDPDHAFATAGGASSVVLGESELPSHVHPGQIISNAASAGEEGGEYFTAGEEGSENLQFPETNPTGTDEAHENMPPYLVVKYIIKT